MELSPGLTIALVANREFGDSLLRLVHRVHVWICDTPKNRAAAEKAWANPVPTAVWDEAGVTTFHVNEDDSPESMLFNQLPIIDEHHDWTTLEVYGPRPTEAIRQALLEYTASIYQETSNGFICIRERNR